MPTSTRPSPHLCSTRLLPALALLLAACLPEPTERWELEVLDAELPRASWEPIRLDVERQHFVDDELVDDCAEVSGPCDAIVLGARPRVRDALGVPVAVEPLSYAGSTWAWGATSGFAPGSYTITGVAEFPEESLDVRFTVGDWGEQQGFDPATLAGRAWELGQTRSVPGTLDIDLGRELASAPPVVFEVLAVEGGQALFRAVARTASGDCRLLQDHATVDASGSLSWRRDALSLTTAEGVTFTGEDLSLAVSWSSADTAHALATASGRTDTAPLAPLISTAGDDDAVCDLLASIGMSCVPCDDERPYCATVDVWSADLAEITLLPAAELPACGVDLTDVGPLEIPPISCDLDLDLDIDCGCSALSGRAGLPGLLVGLLVLLARRRRR